jgi:hypothetical protein
VADLDISRFVGAASAPVALIIATSIFLSNLTTKWWAMTGVYRALSGEYRGSHEHADSRSVNVRTQLECYSRRLALLMRATLLLTLAILAFILTVIFTGINMIFPKNPPLEYLTVAMSFCGLLLLATSVVAELVENEIGKRIGPLETGDFDRETEHPLQHTH